MSLPGVRTILKDRFYSLSRTDAPEGTRIVVLARRNNAYHSGPVVDTVADLPAPLVDSPDTLVRENGVLYSSTEVVATPGTYEWTATNTAVSTEPNLTHYTPRSERDVIRAFGQYSDAHLAYVETTSGGASRVVIVPLAVDANDTTDLDAAFEEAEVARADIVVPFGYYADDAGVAAKVVEWCKVITDRSNPVFAVLGVDPEVWDGKDVSLLNIDRLPDGQYLATVVAKVRPRAYEVAEQRAALEGTELDLGWGSGAPQFAALLAELPAESAPTGKRLRGVDDLAYELNRTQQAAVIEKGGIPVVRNFSRQPVVVDGQTSAPRSSDYYRISTLRIVFDATQLVRRAMEAFVGQPATLENRNAMDTAVTSVLRDMILVGALITGDHVIQFEPRENKAYIDLWLTPAFEIRNIEVAISVQL